MDLIKALLSSVVWNSNFEEEPEGGDDPSYGDDEIRLLKEAFRERFEKGHTMDLASGTVGPSGWHKSGTVKVYFQASEPTKRPDGTTDLDSNDNGRIWINSSDYLMKVYKHGDGWVSVSHGSEADSDITFTGDNTYTGENTFEHETLILENATGTEYYVTISGGEISVSEVT